MNINSINELRTRLNGAVITPGDAGYDEARALFYGGMDHRPAVIVRAADAADVARVVTLARETGQELGIRSGGHSLMGHSVPHGGLMLDLSNLRSLQINVENQTAWVGAGMTTGEYTTAAGAYGLATGFGDTGSVGIGGITLGGGVGFLSRKHGLTIDNLLAADIVTADGQLRRVSDQENTDLFWAIRGGGGNFGVVTRFQFRLHKLPSVYGGMLILPATPDVIAGFVAEAEAAPEELSTIVNVMTAPPMPFMPPEIHGKMVVFGLMVYAGDDENGQRVMAPFRALDKPIVDMLRPMRFHEMFPSEEGGFHPIAVSRNMFVDQIGHDQAQEIINCLQASDAPMRVAQLRILGGAISRVPADATAYAHRNARIMVNLAAFYNQPDERAEREAWINEFAESLDQGYSGAYVNFMTNEGARSAYPDGTWEQLAAIKSRYDPTNLFHHNHNILPAERSATK